MGELVIALTKKALRTLKLLSREEPLDPPTVVEVYEGQKKAPTPDRDS